MHTNQPQKIGLFTLSTLVCGNMIGSGIFLLPASLARIGSISLLSWIFTGIGALCLAILFAHISTFITKTGGPYAYARAALGKFIGFQTAYCYWIGIWVGNAAMSISLAGYIDALYPATHAAWQNFLIADGAIWLLTLINLFGVKWGGFLQSTTTVLKVIPIFCIGLFGWFFVEKNHFILHFNITEPHISSIQAISMGAALTLWAFIGLESATVPAEFVSQPKRNIPLATLIGTSIALVVYIISSSAIMGMIPANLLQHSIAPFSDAAKIMLGHWGVLGITLAAIISCFGALNGWVLLQAQIPMAAARDGLFPQLFAETNQYQVPAKGMILTSTLITVLLFLTTSEDLIHQFNTTILLAVLANLIPYLYTTTAYVLYLMDLHTLHHILKKLLLSVSLIAFLYAFWAIYSSGITTIAYGTTLLLTSIPCYAWIKKKPDHSLLMPEQADS